MDSEPNIIIFCNYKTEENKITLESGKNSVQDFELLFFSLILLLNKSGKYYDKIRNEYEEVTKEKKSKKDKIKAILDELFNTNSTTKKKKTKKMKIYHKTIFIYNHFFFQKLRKKNL